jgi:hypothetical protein
MLQLRSGMSEMAGYRATRSVMRLALGTDGVVAAATLVGALVASWLMAGGHDGVVIACCAAIAVLAIARWWPGPFVALMALVIMNGVPVVDLSKQIYGSFGLQDCAVLALAAGLYWYRG